MPSGYSVLRWQRVEVTRCQEAVVAIFTFALEAKGYWFAGW